MANQVIKIYQTFLKVTRPTGFLPEKSNSEQRTSHFYVFVLTGAAAETQKKMVSGLERVTTVLKWDEDNKTLSMFSFLVISFKECASNFLNLCLIQSSCQVLGGGGGSALQIGGKLEKQK